MANKYQSSKTGKQIDASVDYTERLPIVIENINNEIENLTKSKAEKNTIPQKLSDIKDDITEQNYDSSSTKPQSGKAVAEALAKLIGSAPENLDTLEELAKALNEDENFSATVLAELAKKQPKEDGKGLSTNDFTDTFKNKLNNISYNATSSPKVITIEFEEGSEGEGWESWMNKTFFNQYSDGLYYIRGGYYLDSVKYYESVILLCTSYEDGGEHINRLLITQNGDMYTNYTEPYNPDTDEWESYHYAWQKISVSQTDLAKAIGDVEKSLENIIQKYGLNNENLLDEAIILADQYINEVSE